MDLASFDYYLPEDLISQEPLARREDSRLMIVRMHKEEFENRRFPDIVNYLSPGDALVINSTRVIPARLTGVKSTGAQIEILLLNRLSGERWEALVRPGRRAPIGTLITIKSGELECQVLDNTDYGGKVIEFSYTGSFIDHLEKAGDMPVPPYIKKPLLDRQRYQTVYARQEGSAAAPTAGLHFSRGLLESIKEIGVLIVPVLLHVGLGTFRPVEVKDIRRHHMHSEYYEISEESAELINMTRARGGRIIAVGTTTTRCLEGKARCDSTVGSGSGWTDLFIYPGYRFKIIDGMLTNFHLPRSTLLMMVAALAGQEKIMAAYREAVREKYRFYSFGDAMLII